MRPKLVLSVLFVVFACLMVPPGIGSQEQTQQSQDQTQKEQQQKEKKKGGFFGGLKAVTGGSSEQTEATATAGSKSVGEGQRIGNAQPTAADRKKVSDMEKYSIPEQDLKKFQQDGQLQPGK